MENKDDTEIYEKYIERITELRHRLEEEEQKLFTHLQQQSKTMSVDE